MHSLTFIPFGTSSVKGIWRLSWRVTDTSSRGHAPPCQRWSDCRIQWHLQTSPLRAARPFVLLSVQTFPAQPVGVPPPCYKHNDDDLSWDTTHSTRPIHPSVHSSSPRCSCCCLLLGMCEEATSALCDSGWFIPDNVYCRNPPQRLWYCLQGSSAI